MARSLPQNDKMKYLTNSELETREIGKQLTKELQPGTVLCLHGELGAGKTSLVKGLAEGFGISETITSPTFAIMNIYQVKERAIKRLLHIDTYRLKSESELYEIGAEDYLGALDSVAVVEWPEKIPNILKDKKVVNVYFNHLSENSREITIG